MLCWAKGRATPPLLAYALRDPVAGLEDGPDAPECPWISEWITVHEDQVCRISRLEPAGVRDVQQLSPSPGHRGQCLVRLEPCLDQLFDFPGQVACADRAPAEVRPGCDSNAGAASRLDGRERSLPSRGEPALPFFCGEAFDAGGLFARRPTRQHRERRHQRDMVAAQRGRDRVIEFHPVLDGIKTRPGTDARTGT